MARPRQSSAWCSSGAGRDEEELGFGWSGEPVVGEWWRWPVSVVVRVRPRRRERESDGVRARQKEIALIK